MLKKIKKAVFKFKPFSKKQLKVLTWWLPESPVSDKEGIIADGAIRSGKTLSMSLSFVMWAMETFDQQNFGMCGKTIGSFRRNVLFWLKLMLKARGYQVKDHRADNLVIVSKGEVANYFYIFGGKDESSQDLIQGITLAGVFFDEVALMPESFVNQATGRCSVDGSKFWFNCNPDGPYHWFKVNWIDEKDKKKLIHLHFTMDDNLSLSEKTKTRYRSMYSGVFFQRYILGLWVMAQGIIYDMFDKDKHIAKTKNRAYTRYHISIDYGTQNPTTFGLWGLFDGVWYKVKEYHYSGREKNKQKTDTEYADDLEKFIGNLKIRTIIVDPSAASFIAELKKRGHIIRSANNDVVDGIRNVGAALNKGLIKYNDCCKETFKEFSSYVWDERAADRGEDKPIEKNDHHMDGDRYFVNTILFNKNGIRFLK
ncbi:PBSX family phage terminase large subunit [Tissierella sp. MB52-C2]|uniref:PBSX family phage terminase large subunit n=1 Tax=Tissierella sp. MB52-C2 TaxID=3070999 RepID=UPI00280AE894|nr:PBSX family phage terminase large subunit [Tissierella sp. MB52-C2]WMM24059.1 PBSX family phage terminase large subunit [Tissierella sp. MB52-C2]